MNLRDRVAVVTGTSKGIGKAIAIELAASGAKVACISRDKDALNKLLEIVNQNSETSRGYICDISDPNTVASTVKQIVSDFGKIDILINNAGIKGKDKLVIQTTDEDWTSVLNTNLNGTFFLSRAVAKQMLKNRFGRILNISSILGTTGRAGQLAYTTSKAGLIGMTKTLAHELASRNITCNAILPGFIDTDMNQDLSGELKESLISRIPLKRYGLSSEVAKLVGFLASEDSGYITGQTFLIDGGLSLLA